MNNADLLERDLAVLEMAYRRTMDGTLEWSKAAGGGFGAESGDFILRLDTTVDPTYPDDPDFRIDILDKSGREVLHSLGNVSLRPLSDRVVSENLTVYPAFKQLYSAAKRKGLGIDQTLDRLLESLRRPA